MGLVKIYYKTAEKDKKALLQNDKLFSKISKRTFENVIKEYRKAGQFHHYYSSTNHLFYIVTISNKRTDNVLQQQKRIVYRFDDRRSGFLYFLPLFGETITNQSCRRGLFAAINTESVPFTVDAICFFIRIFIFCY